MDVKVEEDRRGVLADGAERKSGGRWPDGGGAGRRIGRPESLRVLAQGDTADNELVAHVDRVVLTGARTRVHASLACGTQVAAALPSRFGGTRFEAGDAIRFGFDKDAAIVLDAGRADTAGAAQACTRHGLLSVGQSVADRSAAAPVGDEGVRLFKYRWSPGFLKKTITAHRH